MQVPSLMLVVWAPLSYTSHSLELHRSSLISQNSDCNVAFLDPM